MEVFRIGLACLLLALPAGSGGAETLRVGPGQPWTRPSAAAAAAHDGDSIIIDKGEYYDCAVWNANGLTIAGNGPGVVLTDTACQGKASFVISGRGITLRDLVFTRIRVPDGNGAGIRAEGPDLTIEHSRFENNQIGLLAGDAAAASIVIRDCDFSRNGTGTGTADILAGRIGLLRVEQTRFADSKGGAAITSGAVRTELLGAQIEAAKPAPYLVGAMGGGSLSVQDTVIVLTGSVPRLGAVAVAADGAAAGAVRLQGVSLVNRTGMPAVLLRDWSGGTPALADNRVGPGDAELSTDGALLHRLKQAAHRLIGLLRGAAGRLHRVAALVLHHLAG